MRRRRPIIAAGFMMWLAGAGCTSPARPDAKGDAQIVERSRLAMGSELRLTAWTADETSALTAFEAVFAEFERLDALMSVWREGSDIRRLNAAAGERAVSVNPEVLDVLRTGKQIGEWTDGKFDLTFAALADLWRFDHDQNNQVPRPDAVAARLPLVDYASLTIDSTEGTAFLPRKGMRVHVGGIGKGYAVDRAAGILRARGVNDFLIQAGGDMYVSGRRGGRPWRVGIRDPRGAQDASFATIDDVDGAISTSGDYERFFLAGGRRYHHILDPDTGNPVSGTRSVTIVADRAILADALSTGVFVSGPERGMALIERLPRVEGVIVTSANNLVVSSGLTRRLVLLTPPTDAP